MKKLSIISPIYNEADNIEKLFEKLLEVEKKISSQFNLSTNIILINDGSTDNTSVLLEKKILENNKFRLVNLSKNFGQQAAIFAGLSEFESDLYVTIDSDLQQDPEYILVMLKTFFSTKCQIVQMKKKYLNYESKIKSFFSKIFYKLFLKFTNIDIHQGSSDFYLIDKIVRDKIINSNISSHFLRGFIHWTGYSKVFIEYEPEKRQEGLSKYNFLKQLEFALTGLYFYSSKIPIYIFLLSVFIMVLCLVYFLYILAEYFVFGTPTPGWSSTIIIILIFGAINIFFNSIIIFLIFKIFNYLGRKPIYIKKDNK